MKVKKVVRCLKYPRKYLNLFLQRSEGKMYPDKPRYFPSSAQVELTTTCNMACPRCERSIMNEKVLHKHASLEFARRFDPLLPYMNFIALGCGLGEALTNPHFWNIHNHFKKFGVKTHMVSNALLLYEDNIRKIFENKTNSIDISLDGINPEIHEKIRPFPKGNYNKVISNIKTLCQAKETSKSDLKISIGFTAHRENMNEIYSIIRFVRDNPGIDNIWLTTLTPYKPEDVKGALLSMSTEDLKDYYEKAKNYAEQFDVVIRVPKVFGFNTNFSPCPFLWNEMTIFMNGDVSCCPYYRSERKYYFHIKDGRLVQEEHYFPKIILGNIFEESIKNIWTNNDYFSLRLSNKKNTNPLCNACYFRYAIT